ncbi:neutral zinc metallopeptidase [Nonomuraea sp. NPDC001023]|uniref:neutral zinc metallopeptidase n=1 Tax=Nonomuraea sp. NPDC001023 TaxID=3154770 RepID=UPI00331EC347
MRPTSLIVPLLVGVLAGAAFSGTAGAASAPAVLTKNPLYKAGKFALKTCEEPYAASADVEVFRRYVEEVSLCLDKAWGPLLTKAGLRYTKPEVVLSYGERVKTSCGIYAPDATDSVYCTNTKTIHMMVSDYGLKGEIDKPQLLEALSAGYAIHVQNVAGIMNAVAKTMKKLSKRDALALQSRYTLQTLCFSGAFTGSVWDSLGHTREHGQDYYIDRHVIDGNFAGFGKASNRVYWIRRGFESESPSVCNTFTAPAARVK